MRSALKGRVMRRPDGTGLRAFATIALCLVAGCGTSNSSNDASGGAGSGGGGSIGSGGSMGSAGSTGSGGGGGSPLASCPGAVPTEGAPCSNVASCFYEECTAGGRTVASCTNGAWSVETGPCTGVFCLSQTCAIGQVCLMRVGGALLIDCVPNTCGASAIGCGCLQSCAGSACTVGGSLQSGATIQCNTCPSNQCA